MSMHGATMSEGLPRIRFSDLYPGAELPGTLENTNPVRSVAGAGQRAEAQDKVTGDLPIPRSLAWVLAGVGALVVLKYVSEKVS